MPSDVLLEVRMFIFIGGVFPTACIKDRVVCAGLAIFFSISLSFLLQGTHLLTAQFVSGFTGMLILHPCGWILNFETHIYGRAGLWICAPSDVSHLLSCCT